ARNGRDCAVNYGGGSAGLRGNNTAVRRPQTNRGLEIVRIGDFADVYADAVARRGGEGPDVEVTLQNLAGLQRSIADDTALIAIRHRDRTWGIRHREAI